MCWDFKFIVKNQNLSKCRIVAEFFYETTIRAFFRGFQTNCTTRGGAGAEGAEAGGGGEREERTQVTGGMCSTGSWSL